MSVIRRVFGFLRQILGWALALAERIAAGFSRVADLGFRPNKDSGRVALPRLLAWTVLNLLGILAVTLPVSGGFAPPRAVIAAICGAGFVINLLVVSSALLKLREDNDVVNGLVSDETRRIKRYSAVSNYVAVANSIVFLVLFLAAGLQAADSGLPKLLATEHASLNYGAYLLATLKALPISGVVVAVASWLAAREDVHATMFIFGNLGGTITEHAIFFIGSVFLVGLVALWLKQVRDTDRLIEQYLDASSSERYYLQKRIELSPLLIKPRILRAALNPRVAANQTRAIEAVVQLKIFEFPRDFCLRFAEQRSKAVKRKGLQSAQRLVDEHGANFPEALAMSTLSAAVSPLARTRPGSEKNLGFLWLAVTLMQRVRNIAGLPTEKVAVLFACLPEVTSRKSHKDDDLQTAALDVALRHDFSDSVVAFVSRLDRYPRKVASDGVSLIRQKIEREYGPSRFSSQIIEPLKKVLEANLPDEVRAPTTLLLQIAVARNAPQPTFKERALGWIPGLKPSVVPVPNPTIDPNPASSHAA